MANTFTAPTDHRQRSLTATWTFDVDGDDSSLDVQSFPDITVMVTGTDYGSGGTLVIQGSLDGTTWVTLSEADATALSFTANNQLKEVLQAVKLIRPSLSGSTSPDLEVRVLAQRAR